MKLPNRPLTNIDLIHYVKKLKIPYFRGVYMRDNLPSTIFNKESGIVNLDDTVGEGTHWTAYVKHYNNIEYFDSIGQLKPPLELIRYFRSDGSRNNITYNFDRLQKLNSYNCGHLVLLFLYNNVR